VIHGFTIRPLIGIILDQAETAALGPTPGIEPGFQLVDRISPPQ